MILTCVVCPILLAAVCAGTSSAAVAAFERARSIWPIGQAEAMNSRFVFSAEFEAVPDAVAELKLVAWYAYRVKLNDAFVAFGPARGPKGFFRADVLPLRPKAGRNVVTIEVAGYNVPNFYLMEQPPFVKAEIVCDGRIVAATGVNGEFKATWANHIVKVPRYSYQRTFAEVYRLPASGTQEEFALAAAPEPQLIERRVPYPDYEFLSAMRVESFAHVRRDETVPLNRDRLITLPGNPGLSGFKGFPISELEENSFFYGQQLVYSGRRAATDAEKSARSLSLKSGESYMFDRGLCDTGFPGLTVKVARPGRLVLEFDEVKDSKGEARGILRYHGCVNIVVWDFTAPGEYRIGTFEPYTMRYVTLAALEGAELDVTPPDFRSYKNATAKRATFRSSDKALERIFAAASETFRQNAVDVFTDCPSRERAGWNCDAYFIAPVSTLLTGNTDLERVFEETIALPPKFDNIDDGMIPMCYPSDHRDGNYIPNWAMWFVLETEEYLARSGDRVMVEKLRPRLEKLVSYLWKFRNSDGLLEKLPKWVFVEWSQANKLVKDVNYPSNMTWAEVLDAMARLYGRADLAQEAERVRETIRRQSWTGKWFCDNAVRQADGTLKLSGECTETCQYYAFFFGTATKERYPELWRTLLADFGPQRFSEDRKTLKSHPDIWPSNAFIGNYLRLKLLEREGLGNMILAETKGYFKYMADRTGTLWENDTTCASCNHGFASYAAVLLVHSVLGVEKVDLVNRTVTVRDTDVSLGFCEAELPTPDGMLFVGWRKVDGVKKRKVSAPEGWHVIEK